MPNTPFTRHFFICGRYYGNAPAGFLRKDGKEFQPNSYTWTCGHCGEQWAKSPIALGEQPPLRFQHHTHTCPKCRDEYPSLFRIPGSIWCGWDESFRESWTKEVWERELELHCEALEKGWN